MKSWLRQHHYACKVALRRLAIQPFSSLANVFVISLSLAVPIVAASVLSLSQPILRHMPVLPEITLFMKKGISQQAMEDLSQRLEQQHADVVIGTRIVSSEQALERLQVDPTWSEALSALEDNPLPDAIIVTLKESPEVGEQALDLAGQWQDVDEVDSVQIDSEWVRRLGGLLGFLRVGLSLLAGGVVLVVFATVFNTVRMQALSQREEIAVARLVGATESFVRRPFLYLGALTGVASSLLATGLAALALVPLNAALERLAQTYRTNLVLYLPDPANLALMLALVAILAALAARWSVTRNTRF